MTIENVVGSDILLFVGDLANDTIRHLPGRWLGIQLWRGSAKRDDTYARDDIFYGFGDNFRLKVANVSISGSTEEDVSADVCVKLGDCRSNRSRVIMSNIGLRAINNIYPTVYQDLTPF